MADDLPPRPHEDDAVLLCMPLGTTHIAAGSLKKYCDICNKPITASRASLEAVIAAATEKNVKWWLVCLECAPSVLPKDNEVMPPTPEQLKEVRDELRRLRERE